MALTLAEAEKYSTNQVLVGVAEISMDANPLLAMLPFIPVRGNALQYQRELAASAPTFIAPGGTVTEGVPTTTQLTAALKVLIGDADIDNFLRTTRSKDQALQAELLTLKARNFADTWGDKAIYGSIDADANEIDGVHQITEDDVTGPQVHTGADATPDPGPCTPPRRRSVPGQGRGPSLLHLRRQAGRDWLLRHHRRRPQRPGRPRAHHPG